MDEAQRKALHQAQTDGLYAAIGRFAVKFEQLVHAMQTGILILLQSDGLRSQALGNAVLAGLTADPIKRMFRSVVAEILKGSPDSPDQKILNSIMKRVQALIEERNDVIHRVWFIGWASADQTDFSSASSFKHKNTKDGPRFSPREATAQDFDLLSSRAEELMHLVNRVTGSLITGGKLERNFDVDAEGLVTLPPGTRPGA